MEASCGVDFVAALIGAGLGAAIMWVLFDVIVGRLYRRLDAQGARQLAALETAAALLRQDRHQEAADMLAESFRLMAGGLYRKDHQT